MLRSSRTNRISSSSRFGAFLTGGDVTNGHVTYRQNGVGYTNSTVPNYPLFVNTSLNDTGATLMK